MASVILAPNKGPDPIELVGTFGIFLDADGNDDLFPAVPKNEEFAQSIETEGGLRTLSTADNPTGNGQVNMLAQSATANKEAELEALRKQWEQVANAMDKYGGELIRTPDEGNRIIYDVVSFTITSITDKPMAAAQGHARSTFEYQCLPFGRMDQVTVVSALKSAEPYVSMDIPEQDGTTEALVELTLTDLANQARKWACWGMESRYYDPAAPWPILFDSVNMTTFDAGVYSTIDGAYSRNLATGGDFENQTVGVASPYFGVFFDAQWTSTSGLVSTTNPVSGTKGLRVQGTKDANTTQRQIQVQTAAPGYPVAPGGVVSMSVKIKIGNTIASGPGWLAGIDFYNSAGTYISSSTYATVAAGATGTQTFTVDGATVPANAVTANILIYARSTGSSDVVDFTVDEVHFVKEATAGTYSQPGGVYGATLSTSSKGIAYVTSSHVGRFVVRARFYSPGTTAYAQLGVAIRGGGVSFRPWVQMPAAGFVEVTLGEARIDPPQHGSHSVTFYVYGKASTGTPSLFLDWLAVVPAERYGKANGSVGGGSTINALQALNVDHDSVEAQQGADTWPNHPGRTGAFLRIPREGGRIVCRAHRNNLDIENIDSAGAFAKALQADVKITPRVLLLGS